MVAWSEVHWRWQGRMAMDQAIAQNLLDISAVQAGSPSRALAFEPLAPAVTLGKRARTPAGREELAPTLALAALRGWPALDVERGGLATLHLPGQLVVLLAVRMAATSLRPFVAELLEAAAATARDRGCACQIDVDRDVGVWTQGAKLASIGLSHQHGVAGHGLALNAAIDTRLSSGLTLCGHRDARTASVCAPDRERPQQLGEFAAQLHLQLLARQTP